MATLDILFSAVEEMGIKLQDKEKDLLKAYHDLILKWGGKMALVSRRDLKGDLTKHFFDSLSLFPHLQEAKEVADLGSGAGFPGIPLKILLPESQFHLIERRKKKAYFLKEVVRVLGLPGVSVYPMGWEEVVLQADHAITRATGDISYILRHTPHIVRPKGTLIVYSSQSRAAPLPAKVVSFHNPFRGTLSYLLFYPH